jgi:hypothetical protein
MGNPLPLRRDIRVIQGAAQTIDFQLRDLNGNPIDLTGYGARAMFRGAYDDPAPTVSLTMGSGIVLGSDPTIFSLTLSASQATTLYETFACGVWDLFLDPGGAPDGRSYQVLRGDVTTTPAATR